MSKASKATAVVVVIAVFAGLLAGAIVWRVQQSRGLKADVLDFLQWVETKDFGLEIEYAGLRVDPGKKAVVLDDVIVRYPGWPDPEEKMQSFAEELIIYDVKDRPYNGHYEFKNAQFVPSAAGQDYVMLFSMMGYDLEKLKSSGEIEYYYDRDRRDLRVVKLSSDTPDMAYMEMDMHLSDIDLDAIYPEFYAPSPEDMALLEQRFEDLFFPVTIHELNFVFRDYSYLDRILNAVALMSMQTRQEMINEAVADIDREIAMLREKNETGAEVVIEALGAAKDFLGGSKTIHVSLKPDTPVSIRELGRMRGLEALEALNLSVEAY